MATAGYISIAKERNLDAFFIYTEFPPCRVWLEHWRLTIWFVTELRNPAQFPTQSTFFPTQFAPKIPHNFNFSPAPCQKAWNETGTFSKNRKYERRILKIEEDSFLKKVKSTDVCMAGWQLIQTSAGTV